MQSLLTGDDGETNRDIGSPDGSPVDLASRTRADDRLMP
jgi:hypothetical protein